MDTETKQVTTAGGNQATIVVRSGTSDLSIAGAFFRIWDQQDDEYRLRDLRVRGTFLDIGAHIGLVTVAVLVDNPDATAVCVEPLAENCEMIAANAAANGLTDRVTIRQAAIGPGRRKNVLYDYADQPGSGTTYLSDNRFVGGLDEQAPAAQSSVTVPTVTLAALVKEAGGAVDALKLDCEGCEWRLLAEPAVRHVRVIFGEWHGHGVKRELAKETLTSLLGATHEVEILRDLGGTGDFRAVAR